MTEMRTAHSRRTYTWSQLSIHAWSHFRILWANWYALYWFSNLYVAFEILC